MTITLPVGAGRYLEHVDVEWADVDEDVLSEANLGWQAYSEVAAEQRDSANHAVGVMAETNTTLGLVAFQTWFVRIAGGAGYMRTFAGLAQAMAASLQAARVQVVAMKVATLACLPAMQLIYESDTTELGPGTDEALDLLSAVARQQVAVLQASLGIWTDLLHALGVPLTQLQGLGIGAMAATLRSRPIHSSRERIEHHRRPIAERLATAPEWRTPKGQSNDFPQRAAPDALLKRTRPGEDEVMGYAEYDRGGRLLRRVDLNQEGAPHGDGWGRKVPPPHTHFLTPHWDGETEYLNKDRDVRPATPEETP